MEASEHCLAEVCSQLVKGPVFAVFLCLYKQFWIRSHSILLSKLAALAANRLAIVGIGRVQGVIQGLFTVLAAILTATPFTTCLLDWTGHLIMMMSTFIWIVIDRCACFGHF
jgi:hypothetical protein